MTEFFSRTEVFSVLDKEKRNLLKVKTRILTFIKLHLQPCTIKQCQASEELGGRYESSPNMTLRQNQLWFPVTSPLQYVHVKQHESKGGHGEKAQQEESKILLVLQRLMSLS